MGGPPDTLEIESVRLPKWLPEKVNECAKGILPELVGAAYASFSRMREAQCSRVKNINEFQENYQGTIDRYYAILRIFISPDMSDFWDEIDRKSPSRISFLPNGVLNTFTSWDWTEKKAHYEQKRAAIKVIKAMDRLLIAIQESSMVHSIVNVAFWESIDSYTKAIIQNDLEIIEKFKGIDNATYGNAKNENIEREYISSNWLIDLTWQKPFSTKVIADVNATLKRKIESGYFSHDPRDRRPAKMNADDAKRIFFERTLDDFMYDLFSERRPSLVVTILSLICPDWNIDASLVCRNRRKPN
jgi:hypothetical protein